MFTSRIRVKLRSPSHCCQSQFQVLFTFPPVSIIINYLFHLFTNLLYSHLFRLFSYLFVFRNFFPSICRVFYKNKILLSRTLRFSIYPTLVRTESMTNGQSNFKNPIFWSRKKCKTIENIHWNSSPKKGYYEKIVNISIGSRKKAKKCKN